MSDICGVEGCGSDVFLDGLCFWHRPLWEHWGYDLHGFDTYVKKGQKAGREAFKKWLDGLTGADVLEVYQNYPWEVMMVGEEVQDEEVKADE